MTPQEFETLTNQYLDNEISPEDLTRLKDAIAASDLLRMHFNQACKLHLAERRVLAETRTAGGRTHRRSRRRLYGSSHAHGGSHGSASSSAEASATEARPKTGGISLRDLEKMREEHRARMAAPGGNAHRDFNLSSADRRHMRKARRMTRILRSAYPLWMGFVFALTGYVLWSLPEFAAQAQSDAQENEIDNEQARFAMENKQLPLPSAAAASTERTLIPETAAFADASKLDAATLPTASAAAVKTARATTSSAEPMSAKPVVNEDLSHVTALIPSTLRDMAKTEDSAARSVSQTDVALAHLEKSLKEIFETTAY